MSWTPLIETQDSNQDEMDISEAKFRSSILIALSSINSQLCLLNARFEEAFETTIEGEDI